MKNLHAEAQIIEKKDQIQSNPLFLRFKYAF